VRLTIDSKEEKELHISLTKREVSGEVFIEYNGIKVAVIEPIEGQIGRVLLLDGDQQKLKALGVDCAHNVIASGL
jgi:hypothetical protein